MSGRFFHVSIENLDGAWRLCALGNVPDGFRNINGFANPETAKTWLENWARSRFLTIEPIKNREWKISW